MSELLYVFSMLPVKISIEQIICGGEIYDGSRLTARFEMDIPHEKLEILSPVRAQQQLNLFWKSSKISAKDSSLCVII